jgi:predicted nuclease of predicted toxin-antitoxin system
MKLLIDMNLSPGWARWFAEAGLEATHWTTLGPGNSSDQEIMKYARVHGYVVVTHDLDFGAMLAANQGDKPSVVQIRADDVSPDAIGTAVVNALRQSQAELESGALLTIDPRRARLRLLPLLSR